MNKRFTPTYIDKLAPQSKRKEYHDAACRGLSLRVSPTGLKTFVNYYMDPTTKKNKVDTFGRWPDMGIAEARDELAAARKDRDAQQERGGGGHHKPQSVNDLFERYFADHVDGKQSEAQERRRMYTVDVSRFKATPQAKAFGERSISLIEVQDLAQLLISVKNRSNETARKLRGLLSLMFGYAAVLGCIPRNPLAEVDTKLLGIVPHKARTRALDFDAAGRLDPAYPQTRALLGLLRTHPRIAAQTRIGLQLLLLLGLRSGELRISRWRDLDFDKAELTIPKDNMKTEQTHDWRVPLSPQSLALFKELREYTGSDAHIFASDEIEGQPIGRNVFPKAMTRFFEGRDPDLTFEPVTPHDLRRSCRSMLSQLGVEKDVAEKVLNHSAKGIVGTYDRDSRFDDRRAAMQLWADRIDLLMSDSDTKVAILA